MWHGMLFARWTGKNWFRYIVIREHEFRDVNWDLHLGFPFVLFGCILNIAQSSFANYMLCQSAKIMKLLLLSLLFLVRLVWKMPSLLSAIFFLAIYWLSQNQRKYFRKVWVWIGIGTPAALASLHHHPTQVNFLQSGTLFSVQVRLNCLIAYLYYFHGGTICTAHIRRYPLSPPPRITNH